MVSARLWPKRLPTATQSQAQRRLGTIQWLFSSYQLSFASVLRVIRHVDRVALHSLEANQTGFK
jgi:hypothetical protein